MIEYSRQRSGETLQNVLFSFQYNPSRAISSGYDTLTGLQTSDSHLGNRNSHLVLFANLGATPLFLYSFHICKEYHLPTRAGDLKGEFNNCVTWQEPGADLFERRHDPTAAGVSPSIMEGSWCEGSGEPLA